MVSGLEEVGSAIWMMGEANRMSVLRMGVPVQTPASADMAIVCPPEDADARENPQQDPRIEDAGVEPVPRAAGVQPLRRKETREQEHHAAGPAIGRGGGPGMNVVTTPTIAPLPGAVLR